MARYSGFMYFFRKKKRFRLIAGLVAFSVIFLMAKWLQSYTDRLLGQAIVELIARETRGQYLVRYEDLQFEVLKNKLQLTRLAIYPRPQGADSVANRYAMRVQSVALETESLWKIYFTKELKIIGLTFFKPEIEIESFASRQQKSPTFSRQTGNLYLLIKNYLDKFQIRHFALYQASLDFVHHGKERTSDYRFKHVNFVLQNLVIDSASVHNRKKIFYADGFDLSIDGQEIMLPDSLHAFTFDKLEISTQKAAITFRNFRLLPREGLPDYENAYRMNVPELSFEGVDFAGAYNDNRLIINKLQIMQPDIAIDRAGKAKAQERSWKPDRTFLKIMASIFDSVAVSKFNIQRGAFALAEAKRPRLLLPQLDFSLDSFAFAVPDTSETARFPTLKNAALTLHDQRFFIGDSLYTLHMRYLRLTSHPAQLSASGIALHESGIVQERVRADSLVMRLHRWEDLASGKPWHFQQIRLIRPQIRLQRQASVRRPRTQIAPDNRWNTLPNKVLIDYLQIRSGYFSMAVARQSVQLKDCNLQMQRIELPEKWDSWAAQLPLAAVQFSVGETIWQNDHYNAKAGQIRLRADKGFLQAEGQSVQIASRTTDNGQFAADGSVRSFTLKNLIIRDLMNRQGLWRPVFDSLRLIGADLRLQSGKNSTQPVVWRIPLRGTVITENATLAVRGRQVRDVAELWGINGTFLFQSDSLPVIRQEAAGLQGVWAGYRFGSSQPMIDTQSGTLMLHQLTVNTTRSDSALLSLKKLAVQGWDSESWKAIKYLKIKYLQVEKLNGHFIGRASRSDVPLFDSLSIDSLAAESDSFRLELPASRFRVRQFQSRLTGLAISPSAVSLAHIDALGAREAAMRLQPVEVRFSEARLADTTVQVLTFSHLRLIHRDFDGYFQDASLALPEKRWQRHRPVAIGGVWLANGTINLHPDSVRQPFPPAAHPRIGLLEVQNTRLSGEQLSGDVHLLRVEQPFDINEQPFVHAHIGNFRWRLPNQRDVLRVGTMLYQPVTQQLQLDSVSLRPALSIQDFYGKYPVRRSYNTYAATQTVIHAPQWRRLLNGEGFAASSAQITGFDCHVFMDKNMPRVREARLFPLDKFKQMKLPVRIDTVHLSNGAVYYSEKTRRNEIASFSLRRIGGYMYGLTNRPAAADSIRMRLKAAPEGRGEMDLDIYFRAGRDRGEHYIEATFDTIPLTVFNGLAEPMAGIRIRGGQIRGGSMIVTADQDHAAGKMWLYYNNLKFSVLNRRTSEQEETITRRSPLLSMLANTLIRNKNRRVLLYKGKTGYISQSREPERSLFSYWGRIILNGALSSIGISQRTQAKWQLQMQERAERKD